MHVDLNILAWRNVSLTPIQSEVIPVSLTMLTRLTEINYFRGTNGKTMEVTPISNYSGGRGEGMFCL